MNKGRGALTNAEVQKRNLKALRAWLSAIRPKIVPKPGKTGIFYSGNSVALMIKNIEAEFLKGPAAKGATGAQKDEKKAVEGIFKTIQQAQKNLSSRKTLVDYEMLEDVLKRLSSHPVMIDRDEIEKSFSSAYEYLDELRKFPDLFPKPEIMKAWKQLSATYAKNAEGEVRVLLGVADDFRRIGGDKVFIQDEFEALLRNNKLSKDARDRLKKIVGQYMSKFSNETKASVKAILRESDRLKKGGV